MHSLCILKVNIILLHNNFFNSVLVTTLCVAHIPGDSMSRNKDKHEGANNRSYHIMSEAERASGRRGGWTSLEVTIPHLNCSTK